MAAESPLPETSAASRTTSVSAAALSYADAVSAVLHGVAALSTEFVALDVALDRVLAAAITSPVSLPPWDNAGMDGYAVRRVDVFSATPAAPVSLQVIGTIPAGADPNRLPALSRGLAARIMTGAPVPPGSDAVVRIEDTDRGTEVVRILHTRDLTGAGNIRPRGEDVTEGSVVFESGTCISASHLGMLASVGAHMVEVFRQPRVTIVSSGDELVELNRFDEVRTGRKIIASTMYALPALLRQAGAHVRMLPIVPDQLDLVVKAISGAIEDGCDLLITTGGISAGAHDYTRDALAAVGGTLSFWRARIRPGGPLGVGSVDGVPWIGLPGNPVSTMVTAALFAWPAVRALGGHADVHHVPFLVRVRDRIETPAPLSYFVRVRITAGVDGIPDAFIAGPQGSNLLRSMAQANGLLIVPEDTSAVEDGTLMQAILMPGTTLSSPRFEAGPQPDPTIPHERPRLP